MNTVCREATRHRKFDTGLRVYLSNNPAAKENMHHLIISKSIVLDAPFVCVLPWRL